MNINHFLFDQQDFIGRKNKQKYLVLKKKLFLFFLTYDNVYRTKL